MQRLNELGFYTLAGAPKTPRELIDEVQQGEALGLGSVFISERFNIKEAATLSGAVGAVSSEIGIATAATNHNTRHPMVTAAFAMTMHRLTGGRFSLGLGRGIAPLFDAYGLPRIKTAEIEDFVGLMRRIWRGEVVVGHDGPAGKYPLLTMGPSYDEHIPMTFTAFGPNSLALGGRVFDAVVLHTFFTDETTARCVRAVKRAAEEAGRDPATVRVWSCFATIGDHLPEDLRLKKTVGPHGDLSAGLRRPDGEDERLGSRGAAALPRGRAGAELPRRARSSATTEQLEHVATLIPDDVARAPPRRAAPSSASRQIRGQFDLGCDGVILHGASPEELEPIVEAYRKTRPAGRFDAPRREPGWAVGDGATGHPDARRA